MKYPGSDGLGLLEIILAMGDYLELKFLIGKLMHPRETVEYIAHERSIYEYWVTLLPHQVEFQIGASWKGKKKTQ